MTEREQVIAAIRAALTTDTDSITLSNLLYAQGTGLFGKLGPTLEARRAVIASDLWREAQQRVHELEERDHQRFREVVKLVEEQWPNGSFVVKLEPAPAR